MAGCGWHGSRRIAQTTLGNPALEGKEPGFKADNMPRHQDDARLLSGPGDGDGIINGGGKRFLDQNGFAVRDGGKSRFEVAGLLGSDEDRVDVEVGGEVRGRRIRPRDPISRGEILRTSLAAGGDGRDGDTGNALQGLELEFAECPQTNDAHSNHRSSLCDALSTWESSTQVMRPARGRLKPVSKYIMLEVG